MKVQITVFLFLMTLSPLSGRSFETSLNLDGSLKLRGFMLFSSLVISSSVTCVFSRNSPPEVSAGMNTQVFSIGQLGDSGLATEVRNPDFTAISRLSERTFYRANLRSESFSRLGMVLMPWNARVGLSWERREKIDAAVIWFVPVSTDSWAFEILGEAGVLREAINEESWYTKKTWRADGPFALASGRLRYFTGKNISGISFMTSGGVNIRPGWLIGIASSYSSGPWRVRGRGVYSSEYFRNSEGDKLKLPVGGRIDCRYRPVSGLQFALDYEAGLGSVFSDKGRAAVGWRFGEVQISLESNWIRIASSPLSGESSPCSGVLGRFVWDRKFLHFGVSGRLNPNEEWYLKIDSAFPSHGPWLLESYVKLHQSGSVLLLNLELKCRWNIHDNMLVLSFFAGDLGRDWKEGPASSSDSELEMRWIQKF